MMVGGHDIDGVGGDFVNKGGVKMRCYHDNLTS